MTYIEPRPRKDGSITYYVRWIDSETRQRETQKMDSEDSAKLLRAVFKAGGNNFDAALESVRAYCRGVYPVSA